MDNNFTLIVTSEKGTGVFTNKEYREEELVGIYIQNTPSRLGRKLASELWESDPLGRFCNHSERANTTLVKTETGYDLYANRPIDIGDEVTVSYHVVEYKLRRPKGEYYRPKFVNKDYTKYGKGVCEY